jgi:ABC-type uncharacterized transport system YnjBCD ATPase subunit
MTPAQHAKAAGLQGAGLPAGRDGRRELLVACRMTSRKGHIVQVIAPDGTTSDTLLREAGGAARRAWSRKT